MNDMSNSPTGGNNNLAGDVIALMNDLLGWQEHIESAMRRIGNPYTFNDVVASILRQQRQFYEFDGCCIIMEVQQYPQYKTYHCFLACGSTTAILRAEPQIMAVAKELGCKGMTISGRVGWPRRLKNTGWKHIMSTLYKEV